MQIWDFNFCLHIFSENVSPVPTEGELDGRLIEQGYDDIWKQRLQRLDKYCKRSQMNGIPNTTDLPLTFNRLLVVQQQRILYCPIPKAGTSSVKTLLLASSRPNVTHKHAESIIRRLDSLKNHGIMQLRMHPEQARRHILTHYVPLMIVRHPLDRLVSAFADKMAYHRDFFPWYRLHIIARYRHGRSKNIPFYHRLFRTFGASTMEELHEKINSIGQNTTMHCPVSSNDQLLVAEAVSYPVTFSEFISFTLGHSDPHWWPFNDLCPFYGVGTPYIAKIETMGSDWQNVMRKQNLSQGMGHERFLSHTAWQTTNNCTFVRPLPEFRKYSMDMNMFGYSWSQAKLMAYCGSVKSGQCCWK